MASTILSRAATFVETLSPSSRNSLRVLLATSGGVEHLLWTLQQAALHEADETAFLNHVDALVSRCLLEVR